MPETHGAAVLPGAEPAMRANHAKSSDDDQGQVSPRCDEGDGRDHDGDRGVTFDKIDASNYLYAVNHPDGSFAETFIWRVTGFENGGSPVHLPGLGTRFGMYFIADATGHNTAGQFTFDSMNVSLMVDPGNKDGSLSATATGIGFSNGVHGDYALLRASLMSAALSRDPDGTRHADFVDQVTLTEAGEDVFGSSLHNGDMLRELLTTPLSTLTVIPDQNDSGNTTLVNAGLASIQLVSGGHMTLSVDDLGHHGH
jgi:hypothetical protein